MNNSHEEFPIVFNFPEKTDGLNSLMHFLLVVFIGIVGYSVVIAGGLSLSLNWIVITSTLILLSIVLFRVPLSKRKVLVDQYTLSIEYVYLNWRNRKLNMSDCVSFTTYTYITPSKTPRNLTVDGDGITLGFRSAFPVRIFTRFHQQNSLDAVLQILKNKQIKNLSKRGEIYPRVLNRNFKIIMVSGLLVCVVIQFFT